MRLQNAGKPRTFLKDQIVTQSFSALGLHQSVLDAVAGMGYTTPTPVQIQAIPALLQGRDVLAAAQTGTGKTAAFGLPLITLMLNAPRARTSRSVRALILAPTRELAAQIDENIRAYAANTTLKSTLVFGGVNINPQIAALEQGTDFLIATPGRLLDHVGQKTVDLSGVEYLVLDEADRMLDMGFIHDIKKILKIVPAKRQTLLFSATFSDEIRKLASGLLTDPVSVEIARNKESTLIEQQAWSIAKKRKRELLRDLIVDNNWDQVLVFARMKHQANRLAEQLNSDGINAAAIHGNKSQSARTKALCGFKDHTVRVLVATDIAARGLDIEGLPHVVNFELPNVPEDYVHRIGRTGRAGVPGHAVSLVSPDEKELLTAIERLLKRKIPLEAAAGYDGEVPEDIALDNQKRDQARAEELRKMREARRTARERLQKAGKVNPSRPDATAKTEKVAQSTNPEDRFEKKIVSRTKKALQAGQGENREASSKKPARRADRNDDNFGNRIDYKPSATRSRFRPRIGAWGSEPADPFAPENQAIFLPQSTPVDEHPSRRVRFTRDEIAHDRHAFDGKKKFFPKRTSNIISTVMREDSAAATRSSKNWSRPRYESVSSNLPPGMKLKFRHR
jgi:ATP-dependent RNA helicase RhlE